MKTILFPLLSVLLLPLFTAQSDIPKGNPPRLLVPPASPPRLPPLTPPLPVPREVLAKGVIRIEKAEALSMKVEVGGVWTRGTVHVVNVRVGLGTTNETMVHLRFMHNFPGELAVMKRLDDVLRDAEKQSLPVTFIGIRVNDRLIFSRVETGKEIVDLFAP